MTRNTTTPVSKTPFSVQAAAYAAALLMLVAVPISFAAPARADSYQDRINALQAEINQYQSKAGELKDKANTLQGELDRLANEKATIQRQIDLSQARFDQLTADIKANEEKLAKTQKGLEKIVASLYVDDNVSSIEMLASSENIADFVDKREYRSAVQKRLASSIKEVKRLKIELEQQKVAAQNEINTGKNAREALAAKEAEQQAILDQTRGEEAAYNGLVADRGQKKLQAERAQQAAIQAAMNRYGGGSLSGGSSLGSYASWAGSCYVDANAYSHGGVNGNGEDPYGYGCNQCVSYVAWKVKQVTGLDLRYWGNANMWPGKASGTFKVSSQPRAKALGVISAGQYGHIVYIENYNAANNTVDISQYNELKNGKWGQYSERTGVSARTYDTYIYL